MDKLINQAGNRTLENRHFMSRILTVHVSVYIIIDLANLVSVTGHTFVELGNKS